MIPESLIKSLEIPGYRALFVISGSLLLISLIEVLFVRKLGHSKIFQRIGVDLKVITSIRRPIYLQIITWSGIWTLKAIWPNSTLTPIITASLYTLVTLFWASTLSDIGARLLLRLSKTKNYARFVDAQTVGVFLIGFRVIVWSLGIYFSFLAWDIDLTGWLASAGAVGIVLGFAAKDTLANLVAGLAILADHSYQVGDFINIDDKYRGRVVRVGMRATLVQTVQNIQIAIPNALLSNGYVVNETAGEDRSHRLAVPISVAYGTDLDQVVTTLTAGLSETLDIPRAKEIRVLVKELGESGINLHVMVWITQAEKRELIIDAVLRAAYRLLGEAGVEIPFNQLDIRIKSNAND